MTAPPTSQSSVCLNHLRRGATYRATTIAGSEFGEYLGMEAPHGDRAILLRGLAGTTSVALLAITAIMPASA